jgi:cytochrome b subunit of formate dehydrogenase
MPDNIRWFQRFTLSQRLQHVILIITLALLVITGFPLKYADSDISQAIVNLMGGWEIRGIIHRIAGIAMGLLGLYHIIEYLASRKKSKKMLPRFQDFKDFGHYLKYLVGKADHPRYDRYSWKEKFEYWAIVWGLIIMGATGVMMMYPQESTQLFGSTGWVEVAWIAHSFEAMLAVLAVVIWHFWSVHLNPKKFPMNKVWLTGKMTEEEMKEEHPIEYDEIISAEKETKKSNAGNETKKVESN